LTPEEVAYLATDGTGTIDVPLIQAVEPSNLLLSDPNKINFTDYALLANNWLEEQLWPQP